MPNPIPFSIPEGPKSDCITKEVQDLLLDDAIEKVLPNRYSKRVFYSNVFTVPKPGTTLHRPVLNLKRLNTYINIQSFKMEGIKNLPSMVKQTCCLKGAKKEKKVKKSIKHVVKSSRNSYTVNGFSRSYIFDSNTYILSKLYSTKDERFVLDYTELNNQTIEFSYPMPDAEAILTKTGKAKIFFKIDFKAENLGLFDCRFHGIVKKDINDYNECPQKQIKQKTIYSDRNQNFNIYHLSIFDLIVATFSCDQKYLFFPWIDPKSYEFFVPSLYCLSANFQKELLKLNNNIRPACIFFYIDGFSSPTGRNGQSYVGLYLCFANSDKEFDSRGFYEYTMKPLTIGNHHHQIFLSTFTGNRPARSDISGCLGHTSSSPRPDCSIPLKYLNIPIPNTKYSSVFEYFKIPVYCEKLFEELTKSSNSTNNNDSNKSDETSNKEIVNESKLGEDYSTFQSRVMSIIRIQKSSTA
ncbi:hypothetical protein ACTFIW_008776 [Dictyostelium discoideum]